MDGWLDGWMNGFVCLFVHGIPVVCGGRRLTKEGPYATCRQAEAVLFVRRKPTPPQRAPGEFSVSECGLIYVPSPCPRQKWMNGWVDGRWDRWKKGRWKGGWVGLRKRVFRQTGR